MTNGFHEKHKLSHEEEPVRSFRPPSVESPERKWVARVQAGVLIVNQIEPTLVQGTAVRFQFSKDQCRDRATIFGPDLDDCPILLALFSNGCDLRWQWSHGADFTAKDAPTS